MAAENNENIEKIREDKTNISKLDNDNNNSNDDTLKKKAKNLGEILTDPNQTIANKMRTCFLLKQLNTDYAIDELNKGFESSSSLLKHEVAYVMGQMRNKYAVPYLIKVLENEKEESIVRHEAGEGLAAIGDYNNDELIKILEKYSKHNIKEISETCVLALDSLNWSKANASKINLSLYNTVDPAPSYDDDSNNNNSKDGVNNNNNDNNNNKNNDAYLNELSNIYLDENRSLFERYRAMFTLRDIGNADAIAILVKGFNDKSSLFKHEIAFVLGQLMNKNAIPHLISVLENTNEHCMVRHEAAEALGSIAENNSLPILKKYSEDLEHVVKESCEVALDIHDYWNNTYVDTVYE